MSNEWGVACEACRKMIVYGGVSDDSGWLRAGVSLGIQEIPCDLCGDESKGERFGVSSSKEVGK